jgi:hypothetical protein
MAGLDLNIGDASSVDTVSGGGKSDALIDVPMAFSVPVAGGFTTAPRHA